MTNLWFLNRVPASLQLNFAIKLKEIAKKLNVHPNWLMMVFELESKVNPQAKNANTNATGLIQFMPNTAVGLGTNTTKLANMDHIQQLDYVYKYFYPYSDKIKSGEDLYLATFYPLALRKNDDYIFGSEKGINFALKVAEQNPLFSKFSSNDTLDKKTWRIALKDYIAKKLKDNEKVNFFFQNSII